MVIFPTLPKYTDTHIAPSGQPQVHTQITVSPSLSPPCIHFSIAQLLSLLPFPNTHIAHTENARSDLQPIPGGSPERQAGYPALYSQSLDSHSLRVAFDLACSSPKHTPCPPPPPRPPSGGSRLHSGLSSASPIPHLLPILSKSPEARRCRLSAVAMATEPHPSSPWGWAEDPASQTDKGVPVTVATVSGLSSPLLEGEGGEWRVNGCHSNQGAPTRTGKRQLSPTSRAQGCCGHLSVILPSPRGCFRGGR